MSTTADSIETLAFFLQQAPGVGTVGLRNIFRKLSHEDLDPRNLLSLADWKIQAKLDLEPESIAALRSPSDHSLETWNNLERNGVTVLVRGFCGYPKRLNDVLGDSAPPILYVSGNRQLLDKPSAGFCGSRLASSQGIGIARQTARLLAQESIDVVSGYAKGVDIATHSGALEAGGTTTIVLAEGILHFRLKEKELPWLGDDPMSRILVISEFAPRLPWKAHNAMTRNRTICALSDALVVIESGMEGGTFDAGNAALKLGVPLFCVKYAQPLVESALGNAYFLEHGAIPLQRSPDGYPNVATLIRTVRNKSARHKSNVDRQPEFTF